VKNGNPKEHVSADRLQAFLDGELSDEEGVRIEGHLAGCARCSAEFDAWQILFEDLGSLPSHQPQRGFHDVVMANVRARASAPLAARVRAATVEAMPESLAAHLDEGTLGDFLDGALSSRGLAAVEAHLVACRSCSAEAESWLGLVQRLESLQHLTPGEGFADRVISGLSLPQPTPLAARVGERLAALLPSREPGHLSPARLQDFIDGALAGRRLARAQKHLAVCSSCSDEVEEWRGLLSRIAALETFEPGEAFAEGVMAHVRIGVAPVVVAPPRVTAWKRALASAKRLVPQTRQAWAAISGVAVTPAVTLGLVFYVLASHPTLTPGGLASFAWWQLSDLVSAAWTMLATTALQSGQLLSFYALVDVLAAAPLAVAAGGLAYSLSCALALRVLYKNLFARRPTDGRYAHVSAS
jgi:anti-sigma factor RsiW